jgi:hypothetical protein
MDKWSREAEALLASYLSEVRRLAESQGEDAGDIVSNLREHIVCEVEAGCPELVTEEHVKRIIAQVGAPEDVVEVTEPSEAPRPAVDRAPQLFPPAPPSATVKPSFLRQWCTPLGCLVGTIVVVVLMLVVMPVACTGTAIIVPSIIKAMDARQVTNAVDINRTPEQRQAAIAEVVEAVGSKHDTRALLFLTSMAEQNPEDVAAVFSRLDAEKASGVLDLLSPDTAAIIVREIDTEKASGILDLLSPESAASILRGIEVLERRDQQHLE